jgi:hypothetical protein
MIASSVNFLSLVMSLLLLFQLHWILYKESASVSFEFSLVSLFYYITIRATIALFIEL